MLVVTSPEKYAFSELPSLNTNKEEEGSDKYNAPLPADALVPEDGVVNDWDIEDREDGNEAEHDGQKQELVPPDVASPLSEVSRRSRLHHEE